MHLQTKITGIRVINKRKAVELFTVVTYFCCPGKPCRQLAKNQKPKGKGKDDYEN